MNLHIEQREKEGIVILDLKGRLVLGSPDQELRERLQQLRDSGHVNVILNLKGVTDIDTSALGTMVSCLARFRESGGRVVLLHLLPAHTQLSNIVELDTVFEMYQEEVDALNSFFPERVVPHYDILEFVEELERQQRSAETESAEERGDGQAKRGAQEIPK